MRQQFYSQFHLKIVFEKKLISILFLNDRLFIYLRISLYNQLFHLTILYEYLILIPFLIYYCYTYDINKYS